MRLQYISLVLFLFIGISLLASSSAASFSFAARSTSTSSSTPTAFRVELFSNSALTHRIRHGHAPAGSTLYVDVVLINAQGNPIDYSGSGLLLVVLSATSGSLSATDVYIVPGHSDTASSFGGILWALPSSVGLKTCLSSTASIGGAAISGKACLITTKLFS